MVNFGCVTPLVEIITEQKSTDDQKWEALNTIYFIKEDKNFSHNDALNGADGLVEAIANLQVLIILMILAALRVR